MSVRVYLGDLRYNYSGVLANDCMPLGVAYMKAVMDREDKDHDIQSRLFVYPEKLAQALVEEPPDVLMLTNYVWNEALSHYFFRLAKQINPNVLTVMGGPNISLETARQCSYVERHPSLDVYALGVVLYEMLTGHPPFQGLTTLGTLDLIRKQQPVPVREVQPYCPADLETICLKCLRKNPKDRYLTASDLADDLSCHLSL